eukprot:scaffold61536_cov31-Phaeocystis_antarctica.AAC.2
MQYRGPQGGVRAAHRGSSSALHMWSIHKDHSTLNRTLRDRNGRHVRATLGSRAHKLDSMGADAEITGRAEPRPPPP